MTCVPLIVEDQIIDLRTRVREPMRNESSLKLSPNYDEEGSLASALDQNVHVQNLVQESAEELSSVNAGIKVEIANQVCPPGFEHALEKSEAVEGKVQEASDKLSVVNQAIKGEIEERGILEQKLAAVTEQGEVDRRAAMHDFLTDLPNRALFYDRLEHGFQQAKRHGWSLAVLFVDLDDFKVINDTYGHEAGDKVLQVIAGRLVEGMRGEDTVSRHGGDEFLILIYEAPEPAAVSLIAEKLIKAIQMPCDIRSGDITVSRIIQASIGIAICPQHRASADSLVSDADRAMYVAKRSKSGYSFAL